MADHHDPVDLPLFITREWVVDFQSKLLEITWKGTTALGNLLPKTVVLAILARTERLVTKEPTLVEVCPSSPDTTVVIVGDTHGQFHDVCKMFEVAGYPSEERMYIFNGDFIDRGAWGIETLMTFCLWKLALPHRVFLLRGNHESNFCAQIYGFVGELKAKYGKSAWKNIFSACKKVFANLPLAALVNRTLVLHGGLYRKPPSRKRGVVENAFVLGNLGDLRKASKGGLDPNGEKSTRLASDVLWSDPTKTPGFIFNDHRLIGMTFGPEITEQFLRENNLKLIIRSHEGPDARDDREDMGSMLDGWTEDHVTETGRLITVFSAPDYPQFMAPTARRYSNKAAVAVLSAPDYDTPSIKQYEAVLPRPEVQPYYDLEVNDSDDELEPLPSTASGMTDVKEEREGMAREEEEEEEVTNHGNGRIEDDSPIEQPASKRHAPEFITFTPRKKSPIVLEEADTASPTAPTVPPSMPISPRAHSKGASPARWHAHF